MSQTKQPSEFNRITGGLITNANPLTQPPNTTQGEVNFLLHVDGSRERRYGLDFVTTSNMTTEVDVSGAGLAYSNFLWDGAGGVDGLQLVVIQVGSTVFISNSSEASISEDHTTLTDVSILTDKTFSFATIDGKLFIATGEDKVKVYSYDGAVTLYHSSITIKVRDTFGVESLGHVGDGVTATDDLLSNNFYNHRPTVMNNAHAYNLRNQGFGTKRKFYYDYGLYTDPINIFRDISTAVYPSNADSVVPWLQPNTDANTVDKVTLRYQPTGSIDNPEPNDRAPFGSFVIDLLLRGTSRQAELTRVEERFGLAKFGGALNSDSTSGGPSLVAEFAGRIWYAGFSSEVVGESTHTPHLPSYLAYSQIVESFSQAGSCYQAGDPTHEATPDLLDTDGGIIRISGIDNIKKLVALEDSLLVFADNGIWAISGGTQSIFTANSQMVSKISGWGLVGAGSVVVVGSSIFFWGEESIYLMVYNGLWEIVPISVNIKSHYQAISSVDKSQVQGVYDSFNNRVSWLTGNQPGSLTQGEIVFNTKLGAFSLNECGAIDEYPTLAMPFKTPSTTLVTTLDAVTDGGVDVTDSTVLVTASVGTSTPSVPSVHYLTLVSNVMDFKEAEYSASDYIDWEVYDGTGRDAYAYMLMPWVGGPDTQRRKQINYGTFHMRPEYVDTTVTSCIVSTYWDWKYVAIPKNFEAFRFTTAAERADPIASTANYESLACRHKIRGRGRAVSLLIETSPLAPCSLHGWGLDLDINNTV